MRQQAAIAYPSSWHNTTYRIAGNIGDL